MDFSIAHMPSEREKLEALCLEIFTFIEEEGKIKGFGKIQRFWSAWDSGALRIFLAREEGKVVGLTMVCIVTDPLYHDKLHALIIFEEGVSFREYINGVLEIMKVSV